MTRKKKSRKPPQDPVKKRLSKQEKQQLAELKDKKPKKQSGNKPGNRQQEATAKARKANTNAKNKDPRLGSKKPIDLGVPLPSKPSTKNAKADTLPGIAAIRVVDDAVSVESQISAIEQDSQLLEIIAKQEQDVALTEQEVNYYNNMMEQHETLSAQLDDEQTEESEAPLDDDSMWDKLDNTDFSDYQ